MNAAEEFRRHAAECGRMASSRRGNEKATWSQMAARWLACAKQADDDAERYIDAFAEAGADHLLVQAEPSSILHRVLSFIRGLGKRTGAVLDPASPIAFVEQVLHLCDVILVMTVNPGFGGQKFLPEMLPKIRALRRLCESKGLDPWIEADGGQNGDNAALAIEAGADAIVAGSAIFGSRDYAAAITRIRKSASRKALA
jgi:ribulose-phosphate 3-epimerase